MTKRSEKYPDTNSFRYYNANPSNRITGDCVIRAIALAANISWDDALDGLVAMSHKTRHAIDYPEGFNKYLTSIGFTKFKQPRNPDNTKVLGRNFYDWLGEQYFFDAIDWNYGIVANIGGHHTSCFKPCNRGWVRWHDIWDVTDKTVGNFWAKLRA